MSEKSNKRKHTGFVLPRPTKTYGKVCSGEWCRRKFQRLYKEFDELNKHRVRVIVPGKKKNKVLVESTSLSVLIRRSH